MKLNYGVPGQVYNVSSLTGCILLRKYTIGLVADQEMIDASSWIMTGLASK
jgi:hypothetical protein